MYDPPASRFACRVPLLLTQKGEGGVVSPLCPSDISPAQRGKPCPMTTPITLSLALSHRGRGDCAALPLWIPACAGIRWVMRVH